ncbi:MAG TPA: glycosyltransferase family 2 protein [Planctomycetota bacterium]|nr:glycosyltransferase family 2 protein [Planctomycetota bacterium]
MTPSPNTNSVTPPGPGPVVRGQPHWTTYLYRVIAGEVSSLTRYCDRVVQWQPQPFDSGYLLEQVQAPHKTVATGADDVPCVASDDSRAVVLCNGTFNFSNDIQGFLLQMHARLRRGDRVVSICYNPYLQGFYRLANAVGLRRGALPTTFLTRTALDNLARLGGFEVVRHRPIGFCPFRLFGLGSLLNWFLTMVPILRWVALVSVVVLRPIKPSGSKPSLTIVIPARNEKGNIEAALQRMPDLGGELDVIFVEGHSRDGTWEEIQRVIPLYTAKRSAGRLSVRAFQQSGKGKSDAVRVGFEHARGDLLTILDADLTMPPELLHRFYDAWCQGQADFVNGSRLCYPMEGEAMRFLNRLGNIFFARSVSTVLDCRLSDTLCGTKLVTRADYARMIRWRADFGDFDPFGDFELLFPAAILGLGTIDVPIAYRARTYGSTNIQRFRHGLMLLRMTLIGLFRVRAGRWV